MARLIDAYGEHCLVAADNTDCELIFANKTIGVFDNRGEIVAEFDPDDIPTVDAVEVVRCKDCKKCSHDTMFGTRWCNGHEVEPDDFCSYGERRTDD